MMRVQGSGMDFPVATQSAGSWNFNVEKLTELLTCMHVGILKATLNDRPWKRHFSRECRVNPVDIH